MYYVYQNLTQDLVLKEHLELQGNGYFVDDQSTSKEIVLKPGEIQLFKIKIQGQVGFNYSFRVEYYAENDAQIRELVIKHGKKAQKEYYYQPYEIYTYTMTFENQLVILYQNNTEKHQLTEELAFEGIVEGQENFKNKVLVGPIEEKLLKFTFKDAVNYSLSFLVEEIINENKKFERK